VRTSTIVCVVVSVALAGCASWRPPARVDPRFAGPLRSRDVAQGEHIYATFCAACHRGRVNPAGYHWTPSHMRHQIREGNALMPALREARLSDDQVEAVLAYLQTVGAIDGVLPPHPDEWLEDDDGWAQDADRPFAPLHAPTVAAAIERTDDDELGSVFDLDSPLPSSALVLDAPESED
jgi:cytochrome c5